MKKNIKEIDIKNRNIKNNETNSYIIIFNILVLLIFIIKPEIYIIFVLLYLSIIIYYIHIK